MNPGINWIGSDDDSGGNRASRIDYAPNDNMTAYLEVYQKGGAGGDAYTYAVRVTDLGPVTCPDQLTYEPDEFWQVGNYPIGATDRHAFCTTDDGDWIKLQLTAGVPYRIETRNLAPGVDTVLELWQDNGGGMIGWLLEDDNGAGGLAARINFTPATTKTYYAKARQKNGVGNDAYTYDLSVTRTDNPAPVVGAPLAFIPYPQTIGNLFGDHYTLVVQLRWTATDANGINNQRLEFTLDGGPWKEHSQPAADVRAFNVTLTIGHTYRFRIRASDTVGLTSSWGTGPEFLVAGSQETSGSIAYTGTYTNRTFSTAWGRTIRETEGQAGWKADYSFFGGRAAIVATQKSDGGRADIYLDGVFKATIDFYSATQRNRRVIWSISGLPRNGPGGGPHHLEVRWKNSKHASSTDFDNFIDGFIALR
jgi:hypothetical protein